MRLRTSLAAAVGAAALVMALPTSASAAKGTFTASFFAGGDAQTVTLTDPADGQCINAADDAGAFGVIAGAKNATDAAVTLYESDGCLGTATTLAAGGDESGSGTSTEFRSVRFAAPA